MQMDARGVMSAARLCGREAGLTHIHSPCVPEPFRPVAFQVMFKSSLPFFPCAVHTPALDTFNARTLSMPLRSPRECCCQVWPNPLLQTANTHTDPLWDSPAGWIHILVSLLPSLINNVEKHKALIHLD